jgi:hypothetical protein
MHRRSTILSGVKPYAEYTKEDLEADLLAFIEALRAYVRTRRMCRREKGGTRRRRR